MRIEALGESALILSDLLLPAPEAAARLSKAAGVREAWAAFETVGLVLDGDVDLERALTESVPVEPARERTIPVLYDGEDLTEVARRLGLSVPRVVELHARTYECRAVGFCPGFAYLAPLAPELAALARRDSPRPRVTPGSVALAAGMTAVYPLERPGGWWIVGRTPLVLVDEAEGCFPIRAGDRVTFRPIDQREYASLVGDRL